MCSLSHRQGNKGPYYTGSMAPGSLNGCTVGSLSAQTLNLMLQDEVSLSSFFVLLTQHDLSPFYRGELLTNTFDHIILSNHQTCLSADPSTVYILHTKMLG